MFHNSDKLKKNMVFGRPVGGKLLIIALFCIFTMIIQPFYAVIFIGLLGRILLEECNINLLMSKN